MTDVVLYLARADNGTIGRDGALPWRLPADLKRFKAMTLGKPVLMGRKTFESLGRPLPGRRNLVMTRNAAWQADGAERVAGLAEALAAVGDVAELAVIGGAEVYALALSRAGRIELTEVHVSVAGDTVAPDFGDGWRETARAEHPAEGMVPAHAFVTLVRG
jgi:dihydrofolate reductase